jgi:glycerol-3-phosphate dehydrogenase
MNRSEILFALHSSSPSVLIIGAGINGIGVFRDLALNGVDVLLIDRGDFCSGASAASSHMAHGGIRYLENGEFRLVREAVQERNRMIENAPHLVRPLPTTIPIFKMFSGLLNAPLKFLNVLNRPSERGAFVIKVGLMLYDAYTSAQKTVPPHKVLNRAESLAKWKALNADVLYTATYYDGAILSPERLALELILDAEADHPGARALNYVSLVSAKDDQVTLRDELTNSLFTIHPKLVINAAGPWIDLVNRSLNLSTNLIGGTKGSHLVIDHPELRATIGDHEFFFENKDGRIVLIFPLFDKVMIGTSDIAITDPDSVICSADEETYFIEMITRVFPSIKIDRSQIVFRFSGVRPLPAAKAKTTGQISRDHRIEELSGYGTGLRFPIYSLVGGKWTSFRAFAEQMTNKALAFLKRKRSKYTRSLPIGGGRNYPQNDQDKKKFLDGLRAWTNLSASRLQTLFDRYGTRAEQIAIFVSKSDDAPLQFLPDYSRREIAYLALNEKITHLDDLILRRSMLAMLGQINRARLTELAACLGDALGWDQTQKIAETDRAIAILAERHGVILRG